MAYVFCHPCNGEYRRISDEASTIEELYAYVELTTNAGAVPFAYVEVETYVDILDEKPIKSRLLSWPAFKIQYPLEEWKDTGTRAAKDAATRKAQALSVTSEPKSVEGSYSSSRNPTAETKIESWLFYVLVIAAILLVVLAGLGKIVEIIVNEPNLRLAPIIGGVVGVLTVLFGLAYSVHWIREYLFPKLKLGAQVGQAATDTATKSLLSSYSRSRNQLDVFLALMVGVTASSITYVFSSQKYVELTNGMKVTQSDQYEHLFDGRFMIETQAPWFLIIVAGLGSALVVGLACFIYRSSRK